MSKIIRSLYIGLAGLVIAATVQTQESKTISAERDTTAVSEKRKASYKTNDFSKDSEKVLLARMIYGEARGQSYLERVAVGYTAVNRANDGKKWNGENIREAIMKPKQYSCFNKFDKNRKKLMDPQKEDAKSFYECLEISRKILSGEEKDPTNRATHYFNPRVVLPKWAKSMKKIGRIKIGDELSAHEFYKEK